MLRTISFDFSCLPLSSGQEFPITVMLPPVGQAATKPLPTGIGLAPDLESCSTLPWQHGLVPDQSDDDLDLETPSSGRERREAIGLSLRISPLMIVFSPQRPSSRRPAESIDAGRVVGRDVPLGSYAGNFVGVAPLPSPHTRERDDDRKCPSHFVFWICDFTIFGKRTRPIRSFLCIYFSSVIQHPKSKMFLMLCPPAPAHSANRIPILGAFTFMIQ